MSVTQAMVIVHKKKLILPKNLNGYSQEEYGNYKAPFQK